jgi:hypothetical protein
MTRNYREFIERKQREYGEKFDPSDLNPAFVRYFESGERVKVKDYGENVVTGTIGVTTGWNPCFLLMRRSNAINSSWCINQDSKIIAVKRGRTYQAV